MKRSDLVLAITDEDACYIKEAYGIDAIVVNYIEKNEPVKLARSSKIGYLSGNNKINVCSFVNFIKSQGVSEIACKLKGLEIVVAGTICADSEVIAVANANKNLIQLMGPIADKAKFYQAVGVVINPQVSGTGQKIKSVEALSYGVPIISYYEGLKGVCDEKSTYVVADEAEFTDRLDKFVTDSEFRREYSKKTRTIWSEYKKKIDGQADLLMSAVSETAKTKLIPKKINIESCKALLITDFPFWKDKNGKSARVDALVKSVPDSVELHVFAFCSIGRIDRALIEEKYSKVVFHSFKEYEVSEAAYFEERLLSRLTGIERKKYSRAYFSAIQEFLKSNTFDWAIIEYIYLAYLRFAVNFPSRKIIDTHDVMHLREWTFSKFDKKHWLSVAPREELQLLDEFELVLTIQYEEYEYLSMHLGQKSLVVPHIPTKTALKKRNPSSQKLRIGFIGTDSPMNLDGIRYVIPMLGNMYQVGKFELIVAGSVCNNLREERELPFVKVLGVIDSPESFYENIDLTINPCFYGG
ncbi:glycosyltransferase [Ideonella paludis]|uniref:glycosyltransferase n=1 Tax=Ideonella paludis TaxID=1233411 RepID=UPI00362B4FC9